MSSKWGWATLLVAVAGFIMLGDFALAQQKGGRRGGGGRGSIVTLAGSEAVQKELEVDAGTKEKISAIGSEYADEMREMFQGGGFGRDASDEDRQKVMAKLMEVNQKYTPKIKEALKPAQFERLQQISWQAGGSAAFNDAELAKKLDLSKEQQQKITDLNREYFNKQRELFGGGNVQEAFTKMRELSQERDKKAEEVLTADQQAKFKELKGKPFDLSQLQGPPGGRPGGPRKKGDKDK